MKLDTDYNQGFLNCKGVTLPTASSFYSSNFQAIYVFQIKNMYSSVPLLASYYVSSNVQAFRYENYFICFLVLIIKPEMNLKLTNVLSYHITSVSKFLNKKKSILSLLSHNISFLFYFHFLLSILVSPMITVLWPTTYLSSVCQRLRYLMWMKPLGPSCVPWGQDKHGG